MIILKCLIKEFFHYNSPCENLFLIYWSFRDFFGIFNQNKGI